MQWTNTGIDRWSAEVPPDAQLTVKAFANGDGRWTWEVLAKGAKGPMASGMVGSLGAAKNAVVGFLTRAGYT